MDMLINGKHVSADDLAEVKNPYTGEVIDTVPVSHLNNVDLAIDAAVNAKDSIEEMSAFKVSNKLYAVYEKLKDNKDELAELLTKEVGKPINESVVEVNRSIETLKLSAEEAKRIYGEPLTEEVKERMNFELYIMKTMGFPGYFLIVQDFINAARKELGVSVGPGRGSAAGSAVAYCLGITKIDPIQYDLLFERFLNPDRISLPDIDVDFDDDGRGEVLRWVTNKYGQEKVAHIITYGTMATKMAIKDVARVQKLPLSESDRLCKLVPDKIPDKKLNLPNAIAYVPELQAAEASSDPLLRDTIKYAKMLEGNVRGTGVHACGTIICRDDITDWVPVSTADD